LLHPHRDAIDLPPPAEGTTVEALADLPAALAWFTAEHRVLLGAIAQAAGTSPDMPGSSPGR
jgi:hypothetical protein